MPESIVNRDEKRKKIFDAALKAYMDYGIQEATTRQIAEIAGIGKSTIYEYFKNSDELMTEAFVYFIEGISEGRKAIHTIAEKDPVSALSMYLDSNIEIIINEPDKLLLITQYITSIAAKHKNFMDVKKEYGDRLHPMYKSLLDEFQFIITRGIELGVMKSAIEEDTGSLSLLLMALVREMQAQMFLQEKTEIKNTCENLKNTIFVILGINNSSKQEEKK